ncbi:MAG: hypothetical protein LAQ69_35500 [Acidobacteriia bacterium]|nr:hypothetical protein [Terriglobia bacterium]
MQHDTSPHEVQLGGEKRRVQTASAATERLRLKPLPGWIPEVYRLQHRVVDVEGYVALHSNRYSVPVDWIGRRVEVRETKDKVELQLDVRKVVTHARIAEAEFQRVTLAEDRPPRGQRMPRPDRHPEEKAILEAAPQNIHKPNLPFCNAEAPAPRPRRRPREQ